MSQAAGGNVEVCPGEGPRYGRGKGMAIMEKKTFSVGCEIWRGDHKCNHDGTHRAVASAKGATPIPVMSLVVWQGLCQIVGHGGQATCVGRNTQCFEKGRV